MRSIAASNVGEHGTAEDKDCTEKKMNHSNKTANKHYRSKARNGLAVKGLWAIKNAARKSQEKRRRIQAATSALHL